MNAHAALRMQIEHALGKLTKDQLAALWEYLQQLQKEPVAPLYHLHEYAISTGVSDLAEHHDSYLCEADPKDD